MEFLKKQVAVLTTKVDSLEHELKAQQEKHRSMIAELFMKLALSELEQEFSTFTTKETMQEANDAG